MTNLPSEFVPSEHDSTVSDPPISAISTHEPSRIEENPLPKLIDRSLKRLFRSHPQALLELAGLQASHIRFEDSTIHIPELYADHVFIVQPADNNAPPFALYVEYQLQPKQNLAVTWGLKWLGLCQQLDMEVFLLVIYLERGDRVTFPDSYGHQSNGLVTHFQFATVRLWEHRDRILSGEWAILAPLLTLCETQPTEETLKSQKALIQRTAVSPEERTELMAISALLATRKFTRNVLESIFKEEITMLDEVEEFKELLIDLGVLQKWAADPRISDELVERGKSEGITQGKLTTLRQNTLTSISRRFGEVPPALIERIERADIQTCESLFDKSLTATSLQEIEEFTP